MSRVIIPLDVSSEYEAFDLVDRLGERADFYKVGLEFFTSCGPEVIRRLERMGKRVFLDLKLHDIPNTVAGAVAGASELGVQLLTVHAAGGRAMLEVAREAAGGGLRLLAVTVLTSLEAADLCGVWGREVSSVRDEVSRLTSIARGAGVDGVVAAASDAARIRAEAGGDFLIVVPGIRPRGSDRDDQRRVATPAEAVCAGAEYLVVGRAVTRAPDPAAALAAVLTEVEEAAPRGT